MQKRCFLLFFMLTGFFFTHELIGQTIKVEGQIIGSATDGPLEFATIQYGTRYTQSLKDGYFSFEADAGLEEIRVSYVGYETTNVKIESNLSFIQLGVIQLKTVSEKLSTVTITSGKYKRNIEDVTVSMEIIKPGLIERIQSNSFSDVLDKIPGVSLTDGQVSIRGGSGYSYGAGSRVLLLIDNIPALQVDAAYPNWNDIPIEMIGQVEVLKGAGSALYGSAAMNGVVNILTKYAKKQPFLNVETQVTTYMSPKDTLKKWWQLSPYTWHMSAAYARKFGKLDVVGSVFYSDEKSFYKESYSKFGRSYLKINYTPGQNMNFGVSGNFNFGDSRSFFYWKNEQSGAYLADAFNYSANTKRRFTIDPYFHLHGKHNWSHRILSRLYSVNNMAVNNQSNQSALYMAEYQLQKKWEKSDAVLTAGIVNNYARSSDLLYSDTTFASLNHGIYAQFEKLFWHRLTVNGGARWEFNKLMVPDTINGQVITDERYESRPVFRAGLNYKLFPYTHLRASWGQGYRSPSIAEKYISTSAGFLRIVQNPALKSEHGWTAEAGVRQGFKAGGLLGFADFSVFESRYYDMIEFNIIRNSFPPAFAAQNIGDTRIQGLELSGGISGQLGQIETGMTGGYVYINPQYQEFNDSIAFYSSTEENILKYRNKHSFKFDLSLGWKGVQLGLGTNYLSFMEAIDKVFDELIPGVKAFRADHPGGSQIWYASIGMSIRKTYIISVRMDNLFNAEYALRPALLEAPRSISFRLKYNLQQE
ncbi:MAG TPA: hypothetical protein DCQ58_10255 [Saprospirales bacterium]|nr:hypothetical protein [Saprospirales bacterium]